MFGVFLSCLAGVGIVLGMLFLNAVFNLVMMLEIRSISGYKSYYSKQRFIKRFLLINNPNLPNIVFKIMTYVNYVILLLLVISCICHFIVYNQLTSDILHCCALLSWCFLLIYGLLGYLGFRKYK